MNCVIETPNLQRQFATYRKKIGNRLRKARLHRKETVDDAAEAVNISPPLLEKIENGQSNFRVGILLDLCGHYGVKMEEVI